MNLTNFVFRVTRIKINDFEAMEIVQKDVKFQRVVEVCVNDEPLNLNLKIVLY